MKIIATRSVAFVEYTRKLQSDPTRPFDFRPRNYRFCLIFFGSQNQPARALLRASHCGVFSALLRLKMVDFAYPKGSLEPARWVYQKRASWPDLLENN